CDGRQRPNGPQKVAMGHYAAVAPPSRHPTMEPTPQRQSQRNDDHGAMMRPDPKLPRPPQPSSTELIPFWSAKTSMLRSGLLLPGVVTLVVGLLLISLLDAIESHKSGVTPFITVLGAYLVFILLWVIYAYSGSDKPIAALLFPIAIVSAIMLFKP